MSTIAEWHGEQLVEMVELIDRGRAASLQSRLAHERALIGHALKRPVMGWGGADQRNRPEFTRDLRDFGAMGKRIVTDSLWIIAFGKQGIIGLTAIAGVLLLPAGLAIFRNSRYRKLPKTQRLSLIMAGIPVLLAVDSLFNAMVNPLYAIIPGAVIGLYSRKRRRQPKLSQAERGPSRLSLLKSNGSQKERRGTN